MRKLIIPLAILLFTFNSCVQEDGISIGVFSETDGKVDINELFTIESVLDKVLEFLPRIPNEVKRLKNVIESPEIPRVDIGPHCSDPYDCDFKGTCWKHIPEYSVFDISRLNKDKKFDLYNQGVLTLHEIDLSQTNLNPNQVLQVESIILPNYRPKVSVTRLIMDFNTCCF